MSLPPVFAFAFRILVITGLRNASLDYDTNDVFPKVFASTKKEIFLFPIEKLDILPNRLIKDRF